MTSRFLICLPYTLAQECPYPNDWTNPRNFSNDAHDPGGKTMCGIIQREYDLYRKRNSEPVRDVRQLTQAEGEEIYRTSYWNPECLKLPPGLDLLFFDEAVNTGTGEATKVLQHILGIAVDGNWGPETETAVEAINNAAGIERNDTVGLCEAFTARRHDVYKEMIGDKYFDHAWMTRTAEIGAAALKVAQVA
jgi:lysozyme family protein